MYNINSGYLSQALQVNVKRDKIVVKQAVVFSLCYKRRSSF
jgi:hypothetical protein